jgi:O-antigen/teichoic acid export membrane protein
VFVLDIVRGPAAVGVFGVAQQLTEPLALLPASVMAAVFPVISRDRDAGGRHHRLLMDTLRMLAGVGGLIAATGVALGPVLIRLLYPGDYSEATGALRLLAFAVFPVYINYVLTHVLIADDRQRLNFVFNAIVFVLNGFLCFILAAGLGATGAAAAVLASEVVLLGLCGIAVSRPAAADEPSRDPKSGTTAR